MAGPRKPILLNLATGGKNWTKAEIEERMSSEVQPVTDGIAAPPYLTTKQKKQFNAIADQLQRLGIMGETDCDTLARYIIAQGLYEQAVKDLRDVQKQRPKADKLSVGTMSHWAELVNELDKRQDRYFKQAQTAAAALGLTISSRCKLAVPKSAEPPKVNKFAKFGKPIPGKAAGDE
jgi:P27 family predicted phage terminase small subunit